MVSVEKHQIFGEVVRHSFAKHGTFNPQNDSQLSSLSPFHDEDPVLWLRPPDRTEGLLRWPNFSREQPWKQSSCWTPWLLPLEKPSFHFPHSPSLCMHLSSRFAPLSPSFSLSLSPSLSFSRSLPPSHVATCTIWKQSDDKQQSYGHICIQTTVPFWCPALNENKNYFLWFEAKVTGSFPENLWNRKASCTNWKLLGAALWKIVGSLWKV